MVTSTRTPIRTDRLRSLNRPKEIRVAEIQLPAARCPLPASTTPPLRVTADGQREETLQREEGGEKLGAGRGQLATEFAIPKAIWFNKTLKTIEVIRELWEIEDEWWRNHIARRYFDVILDGGKHLVIYQDRLTGKWFAQKRVAGSI